MKKLALTVLAAGLFPMLASAQGTVSFGTTDPATQYNILWPDGMTRAPAGTVAALWWSPDNIVPYVQIGVNTVTVNGWLTTAVIATTGAATPEGATAWFYIQATDGMLFSQTDPFQNATGTPGNPAPLDGWTVIPEPSTLALAAMGMAGLWFSCRRKLPSHKQ
jgi:hypothetical protein